ncbi:hypothetical protein [Pannonibacter tanglangensis]|uniref:Archaeal Type IV pilin N-terminal domain-containing protein n=1 Tax=Pannonibacter tanglangensis TaxID=2750084 RepID=A0ABW9ZC27_9HYPH|nr:hypothetical protein [Pannonibacter sp. XCT-34]NBN62201.1 hypothetical protein [Pannonibacter sp. XCT-34]
MQIEKIQSPKTTSDGYSLAGIAALVAVAILTVIASAAFAFAEMPTQGASAKGNRLSSDLPASCQGQAWGNWSEGCLESLSGKAGLRRIGAITVEERPSENLSVLVRQTPSS